MLKRVVEPVEEPVTVEEVKAELILSSTDDDQLIEQYITAARRLIEDYTKTSLIYQTWELAIPIYELSDAIELPRPPLVEIVSVSYVDDLGAETTVDASYYFIDTRFECVRLKEGYTWESADVLYYVVTFKTGQPVENVPLEVRQAIKQIAVNMYENRENFVIPKAALKLVAPYKRYLF